MAKNKDANKPITRHERRHDIDEEQSSRFALRTVTDQMRRDLEDERILKEVWDQ